MFRKNPRLLILVPILLLPLALCPAGAPVQAAPPSLARDLPVSHCSEQACQASWCFWKVFQGNDYAHMDDAIAQLTAAYNENPDDPIITFLLGATHMWKFLERGRCRQPAACVRDDVVCSLEFCRKAQELNPRFRLNPGFIEADKAVIGVLDGDPALVEEGFEGIRRNTRNDPSLHGFVQGWVFSAMMCERDPRFHEAEEGYFATMDSCAGFRVPRRLPHLGPITLSYVAFKARKDPVCYNNDVAPHNMEGTLLGLGDTYLKQGDIAQAKMAYKSIKRCPSYPFWPYKEQLETRLANPEAVQKKFRADTGKFEVCEPAMFFQSSYACTGCHAK